MPKIKQLQVPLHDRWKDRISRAKVLERLLKHYQGELDPPMDQSQVTIGLRLLDKILPSLKAVDVSGRIEHQHLTRLELEARLIALGRDPADVWQQLEKRHTIEAKSLKVKDNSLNGTAAADSQATAPGPQPVDNEGETDAQA
jgi:hypothetical protein